MNDHTTSEVLGRVDEILREIVGDDWLGDEPISMATSFSKDLELESIEFVALAEKVESIYGKRVDFAAWLAGMELAEILNLTVGQLVEFIVGCLSQRATA